MMNQILNSKKDDSFSNTLSQDSPTTFFKKQHYFYLLQFFISCFIVICFLIFLFMRAINAHKNKAFSDELANNYHISTLYANHNESSQVQDSLKSASYLDSPFVIGMLKIDKINLNYPILSTSNKEFLNVSICRFAGPMPNEIGNLCIAGHNYVDYKFFSRLHELEKNDIMELYDLNGQMKKYFLIDKYEVKSNDLSCTSQNTNGETILTLVTCNNVSGKRLILVAKPVSK